MANNNNLKPALFERFYRNFIWRGVSEVRSYAQHLLTSSGIFSIFFGATESGVTVDEARARRLAAVYISINVLAEETASLKPEVYQKSNGKGTLLQGAHPVNRLISKEPNRYQTPFNFWYTIVQHLKGSGNAFARIVRDYKTGIARELHIVHPSRVRIYFKSDVVYYYIDDQVVQDSNLLHFRQYTLDGVNGISPIAQNSETLGIGVKEQSFRATSLRQKLPGYLSTDSPTIKPEQVKELKDSWKSQLDDTSLTPLLYNGLKYNNTMLSPADAQIIESSRATEAQIYGIFRLPPNFAQDYENNSYKGGEAQDLQFLKHTLNPILECIEQECNKKLFTEAEKLMEYSPFVNFNVDSLLRGDIKTRQSFYESAIKNGYMSPNDVRELENKPPIPNGDVYVMQGAMTTLENIKEGVNYTKEKPSETPSDPEKNVKKPAKNGIPVLADN